MSQQTIQQKFLDEFSLEIILNLMKIKIEELKAKEEEERSKKAIETEKLKIKFQNYGEKPKSQQQITQPVQQEKVQPIQKPIPPVQMQKSIMYQPIKQNQQEVFHKELGEKPQQLPQKPIQQNSPIMKTNIQKSALESILVLVNNPQITHIECQSENTNVIIRRMGQVIRTDIILSKEELLTVVKYYSEKARIPLIEGMLIARVDNIEISAVISENSKSSFVIKKINPNQLNTPFSFETANQNPLIKRNYQITNLPQRNPNQLTPANIK